MVGTQRASTVFPSIDIIILLTLFYFIGYRSWEPDRRLLAAI